MPDLAAPSASPEGRLLAHWLTAARRQGFLALVRPEDWHTLGAVLSFTCRDGRRRFTLDQLALALTVPRDEAGRRLAALARAEWRGQPLAVPATGPDGEVTGAEVAPVELLLSVRDEAADAARTPGNAGSGYDNGGGSGGSGGNALQQELERIGLHPEQARRLLELFPEARVRRQVEWLPRREARNPAAFLIKAVENDWAEPKEGG